MTNDTDNSNIHHYFDLGGVNARDMNLRTWLTGLAMQALMTNPTVDLSPEEQTLHVACYVEAQLKALQKQANET